MTKSRIVILGSTGFLGRCLYENFSRGERYKVYGFSPAQVDLTSDESTLKLRDFADRSTVVIMAASALAKDKSFSSFQKEVAMFTNLANPELLSKIKHFILVSSTAIYGHQSDSAIIESSPSNPDDLYSLAKLIGELIFKRACADCNAGLTIVRPGILYGRSDIRSPLFRFIKNVRFGKAIEIHGNEFTRLVWLHKLDAWRAIELIVRDFKTRDYNIISDGNGTSLTELAETIFEACGMRTGIEFTPSTKVSPNLRFDLSKFRNDFPGFNFIRLENGIRDYF